MKSYIKIKINLIILIALAFTFFVSINVSASVNELNVKSVEISKEYNWDINREGYYNNSILNVKLNFSLSKKGTSDLLYRVEIPQNMTLIQGGNQNPIPAFNLQGYDSDNNLRTYGTLTPVVVFNGKDYVDIRIDRAVYNELLGTDGFFSFQMITSPFYNDIYTEQQLRLPIKLINLNNNTESIMYARGFENMVTFQAETMNSVYEKERLAYFTKYKVISDNESEWTITYYQPNYNVISLKGKLGLSNGWENIVSDSFKVYYGNVNEGAPQENVVIGEEMDSSKITTTVGVSTADIELKDIPTRAVVIKFKTIRKVERENYYVFLSNLKFTVKNPITNETNSNNSQTSIIALYPQYVKSELYKNSYLGEVIAKYVDTNGKILAADELYEGSEGAVYNTSAKKIKDYTLKKINGNPKGLFTKQPQKVIYIYSKNIVTKESGEKEDNNIPKTGTDKLVLSIIIFVMSTSIVGVRAIRKN